MMSFRASSVLLLLLGNILAWDGCPGYRWRCGDRCIGKYAECNCGGKIFNKEAQMWCCQDYNCTGGGWRLWRDHWRGEDADCTGTALNLTQACNQTCNYYKEDKWRNYNGVQRSYVACKAADLPITQCIPETEERDGEFNCRNRADENAFPHPSSLLLDLENILTRCIDRYGDQGFNCSAATHDSKRCLRLYWWCNPTGTYTCDELADKTATGKTIDPQMCSNQSFWHEKGCSYGGHSRCTGKTSGECVVNGQECSDGSSVIKPAAKEEEGGCGEKKLMCTARDGRWAGLTICLEKRFQCDNYVQCEDARDEQGCEKEYVKKGIFTHNDRFRCPSPSLEIKNKTGKFFPMRAIR